MRSLRHCHMPSLYEHRRFPKPKDSGAYVPACAAGLESDRNLTDGARRCARKLMEETHRRDRQERTLQINVSYLAKGLHRCRRTVQRYLGMLEREGYISVQVVAGVQSKMCIGLIVQLLPPLFPRHHRAAWPEKRGNPPNHLTDSSEIGGNPDVTLLSQNKRLNTLEGEKFDPWGKRYPYLNSYHRRFRTLHDPRCQLYSRQAWAEKCMAKIFEALLKALPRPWFVAGIHDTAATHAL
jgi:hypothetical protein